MGKVSPLSRRCPMTKYLLTVLVTGLLLAGDAPKDDAKKDQEALQGTWRSVSGEHSGKELGEDANKFRLTFEKDTVVYEKDGLITTYKAKFKVDPTKNPKTIDLTVTEFLGKAEDKGETVLGIYELDKDNLKWCMGGSKERPKGFSTKGTGFVFLKL